MYVLQRAAQEAAGITVQADALKQQASALQNDKVCIAFLAMAQAIRCC